MHRLFVALPLPEPVRDLLLDATGDAPELRWVPEDNLHLTLRFVGEVERPVADDLAAALALIRSPLFDLRITGVGQFSRRGGGTLWAGVEPRDLVAALAAKVDRVCVSVGLKPERRAFHPHVTLARYGRDGGAAARAFVERTRGLGSAPFAVDRFILFESRLSRHGAQYDAVAVYSLQA